MPSKGGKEMAADMAQRAKNYKRALKYLDSCKHFTYKDLLETNKIAGNIMSESKLKQMWGMSKKTMEGSEGHRQILRNTLIEGITTFESVADKIGKKWWQFWK